MTEELLVEFLDRLSVQFLQLHTLPVVVDRRRSVITHQHVVEGNSPRRSHERDVRLVQLHLGPLHFRNVLFFFLHLLCVPGRHCRLLLLQLLLLLPGVVVIIVKLVPRRRVLLPVIVDIAHAHYIGVVLLVPTTTATSNVIVVIVQVQLCVLLLR